MEFQRHYAALNDAQKRAVDTTEGPVMVIAGPGTGKTELLSMRAANILHKTDTLAENILCLTFTESGATAMRNRLLNIIGPDAYKIAVHTFHSFGSEIINQNGKFFYHGAQFQPADELSRHELLVSIFDALPHNSPLKVQMNDSYTYLDDTLATISELKRSGLTPGELLSIIAQNEIALSAFETQLSEIFTARITKATVSKLREVARTIADNEPAAPFPTIASLTSLVGDSLMNALVTADADNSTKPVTAWRNAWLKKDETGLFVFKSRERHAKLKTIAHIYTEYLTRMQELELYDFDDMILRVVHALEVFPELKYGLQERYQYIMVDEFQDTNLSQMRILRSLADNDANNGRPNLLVVGDDDQAIYSFQGANVGNIHGFLAEFPTTERIVLTENYRSSATILEHARRVITLGEDRLENHLPDINKTLAPQRDDATSYVKLCEFSTIHHERAWLADSIKQKIADGAAASSIAVLARRHHEIVALLPYFADAGVAVSYERRDNALEVESVKACELVGSLVLALFQKRHQDAESLLPLLLSHPAFGFAPLAIWKLSLKAYQNRQSWMEVMSVTPEFVQIHEWLVTLAMKQSSAPLEQILDELIGSGESSSSFTAPFMQYFFAPEKLKEDPDAYLTHLAALKAIRSAFLDYQADETPTLQTFMEFIQLNREVSATITTKRPTGRKEAVTLMTAHKSKGLEFDTVYITGTIDSAWGEHVRHRARLISYPENLPLAPAGNSFDERLRLFFVAATRAKTHLTISYSLEADNGKPLLPASFLTIEPWQPTATEAPSTTSQTRSAKLAWYSPLMTPIPTDMQSALAPVLGLYKLSATHLCHFLDVAHGGPQAFLLDHLLHFPKATSVQAAYGSAIHAALQQAHAHLVATGKQRPLEDSLHDFEQQLGQRHLSAEDYQLYQQRGSAALAAYLEAKSSSFSSSQKAELSFAGQNVHIGEAVVTGTLDLVDINNEQRTLTITDYKTARAAHNWNGRTDYEKMKLHRYKQQLMFYQLLVANSRDYNKYVVEKGVVQFVEPTKNGEIIALEATFSHDDLIQFADLVQAVWRRIQALDFPDASEYEPNYKGLLAFEQSLLSDHLQNIKN